MTGPKIEKTTPVETNLYVSLNAGAFKAYQGSTNPNIGIALGGEIRENNTYVKAAAGYGTAFGASIEVGHEFSLDKNISLDLSGKAEYLGKSSKTKYDEKYDDCSGVYNQKTQSSSNESPFKDIDSMSDEDIAKYFPDMSREEVSDLINKYSSPSRYNGEFVVPYIDNVGIFDTQYSHDGYKKAGASAMLGYNHKNGNIKLGVEGGYIENNAPEMATGYSYKESGMYITPKLSADITLNKNWAITAEADKYQGKAGIKYTF